MWKAEGLLVKPGFDEAGRCPIHENTIQNIKAEGLLVKPDSTMQDHVLWKYKQHSKISTARCRYQSTLRLKPNELES